MSEQYHRLFLRWEVVRGWIPALIFAAICVGLELLFFYNALNTGFVDKTVSIPISSWNLPISIALSLALGNALVVVTLWMNVFESTAYVKAGPDKQVRRILYPLRMIRTAALVLAPFSIILFAPYIVDANWFVNAVASIQSLSQPRSRSITGHSVSRRLTAQPGSSSVSWLRLWSR